MSKSFTNLLLTQKDVCEVAGCEEWVLRKRIKELKEADIIPNVPTQELKLLGELKLLEEMLS